MYKFAAFLFSMLAAPIGALAQGLPGSQPVPIVADSYVIAKPVDVASGTPTADALVARALEKKLEQSLQWIRLVHYRKTMFGGWESEADNPKFFVSDQGRKNPRDELIATIRKGVTGELLPIALPGAEEMTVRCQYPARWKWLLKELGVPLSQYPLQGCAAYENYIKREKPVSLTFVFSGFFVDNPSSSFGHVLLRFNREIHKGEISNGAELLDYGIGYAANATTGNPILYSIGGFAGWFPSTFSALPFYYKVREYSDAESRDLWEYDLNLEPEEVERAADHLWELGSTYFNYYYLKQNCAFHLLALLEAAAPRLNLLARVPFYVIPIDTVKAVTEEPGLTGRVVYRPSTVRVLKERLSRLSPSELDLFYAIHDDPKPADAVGELDKASAARVLDAVLDDIDYRHFRELVYKTDPAASARKQNVLIARAQLPISPEVKITVTDEDRPDMSHGSARWWLGAGQTSNGASAAARDRGIPGASQASDARPIIDGELRYAIHDIHDPLRGYLANASVEFWRMRGRFDARASRAELESFSLFTVTALSPITRLQAKPAWRVNLGIDRVRDRRCDGCLAPTAEIRAGGALEPLRGLLVYTLVGTRGETSSGFGETPGTGDFGPKWQASGAIIAGARLKFSKSWQAAFETDWRRVFAIETFDRTSGFGILRWDHETGNLRSPIAIEAAFEVEPSAQTSLLRFVSYF